MPRPRGSSNRSVIRVSRLRNRRELHSNLALKALHTRYHAVDGPDRCVAVRARCVLLGQLIGHIIHPRGSIAEFLLADGLARCNDFHSTMLGEKMAALRAAEKKAQVGKLRLHKNSTVKATEGSASDMIVARIISADTIVVRTKAGDEKQISLSSIRGPRAKEPSEGPFRDEAKEYLRKKLIGKHVKVHVDFIRPRDGEFEERECATVRFGNQNA